MQYIESGKIKQLVPLLDSTEFAVDIYAQTGVFVLRRIIPREVMRDWQGAWRVFYRERLAHGRNVNPFNPVVVNEQLPRALGEIYRCPHLLDVMERIYPDLALYMQRFLLKDGQNRAPVFLHHDFGYDLGWPEKTSVFIPLSVADVKNGSLICYPGTHKFGYMGDIGEFNPAVIDPDWPRVCPSLEPGDVLMIHECTWHESPAHTQGADRVLAQVTYQPASDPSGVALLRGKWRTDIRIADIPADLFFKRSRASRLRDLQHEVDRLKGKA